MSRRLVYIAFGAAVGILVVQRATKAAKRFTPPAWGSRCRARSAV